MKRILVFIFFVSLFSCEMIKEQNANISSVSRSEVLEKFKKNFPEFFEENIVNLTNYKPSKIEGFQEGAFVVKSNEGPQALYFLISNNGDYFIFNPEIIDVSGPNRNENLMNQIVLDNTPYIGNKNSKIVIVEYSDFQCPACKYAAQEVLTVLKRDEYIDKMIIYYKHLPLSFHDWAKDAAMFSSCIYDNFGSISFWEFHDFVFENQSEISKNNLSEYLNKFVDSEILSEDYSACLDNYKDKKYLDHVDSNRDESKKIGLNSTPSFVINGYIVKGADLVKIIDAIEYFSK